jgi:KaiC/GvpD/RAD55 family RecA-like ATPase
MVKTMLAKRSPLRILEDSTHGGPGPGALAVLASPKGVGKTACLVHIATEKLFQGKPVIHVSYASRVDHIITWYEDIFKEVARQRRLRNALAVHEEVIRKRVIMNFKQDGMRTEQVLRSVEAMITFGKFAAETVIVDGYDFGLAAPSDLRKFKEFARRMALALWFSASLRDAEGPLYDEDGTPCLLKSHRDGLDVIITLHARGDHVELRVVKDHDFAPAGVLPLKLDPKTLLIAQDR